MLSPEYQKSPDLAIFAYEYRYDKNGRLVRKTLPGCGYVQYWYDKAGRQSFIQDAMLREKDEYRYLLYDTFTVTCQNTYNKHNDQLSERTLSVSCGGYSTSSTLTYSYDRLGRLSSVHRLGSAGDLSYAYDLHGWLKDIASSGGFAEHLSYADVNGVPCYNGNVSSQTWQNSGINLTRGYKYEYDGLNRLSEALYGEGGNLSDKASLYNEAVSYDSNGNATSVKRNGRQQDGTIGLIDDLRLSHDGNQLTSAEDAAPKLLYDGAFDFKTNSTYHYNANGALTSDSGKGISMIEYTDGGMPSRIQFSDGSVTTYVYTPEGEKLRTIHATAVPNMTVAAGSTHALTAAETLCRDSTDELLGGDLVVQNGTASMYRFAGGFCSLDAKNGRSRGFYYYNQDHLGNTREVVSEGGSVAQMTNYYPFGAPYSDRTLSGLILAIPIKIRMTSATFSLSSGIPSGSGGQIFHNPKQDLYVDNVLKNSTLQPYKYNGKELDLMYGQNTYDYGARQYDAVLPVWTSMDPLCENDYHVSPYVYCEDNPVNAVDLDGKKVYLYATFLPGSHLPLATHTFLVVKNNENKVIGYFAYGSEYDGIKGIFGGRLKQRQYNQDIDIIKGLDKNDLKKIIAIQVPSGMSSKKFDQMVINSAKSFGNDSEITYSVIPTKPTQGNCNTSTSTVLLKSGLSRSEIKSIEKKIPGINTGFNNTHKPWTKEEQKKAVDAERKINEINKLLDIRN